MEFIRSPQIEREVISRLVRKYNLAQPREGTHLTGLIYCLTKQYFMRESPSQPTDREVLLFAVGFGLEEMLLREDGHKAPEPDSCDGIMVSLDYIPLSQDEGLDLKSTRMSSTPDGLPRKGWPETWMKQFMGYAYYQMKQKELDPSKWPEELLYSVAVIYVSSAQLVAGTFKYSKREVLDNWDWVQMRKEVWETCVRTKSIPQAFKWNEPWECEGCRFKLVCDVMSRS